MTQSDIKEKLRDMKGKTFIYRNEKLLFQTFDVRSDVFVLKFEGKEINKNEDQMPAFLELLNNSVHPDEPIHMPEEIVPQHNKNQISTVRQMTSLQEKIVHNNDKMFDIIDDMISKVKDDPGYVVQASTINDLLKTKIEATKTAILASKL